MKITKVGYAIKNWGMIFYRTGTDETLVMHDTVYKKPSALVQTKVRITIEEIPRRGGRKKKIEVVESNAI